MLAACGAAPRAFRPADEAAVRAVLIAQRDAWNRGGWQEKLTATPNAGGGVFSVALARTADGWRIVHDHTSLDAP